MLQVMCKILFLSPKYRDNMGLNLSEELKEEAKYALNVRSESVNANQ